jgi:hypothetical protein
LTRRRALPTSPRRSERAWPRGSARSSSGRDEAGRTRLDRPFTAEEAKEQDAANTAKLEKGRTGRFEPFLSGEEKQARTKRSRL